MGHCNTEENARGLLSARVYILWHICFIVWLLISSCTACQQSGEVGVCVCVGGKPLIEMREKIGGGEQKLGMGMAGCE